MDFKIPSDRQKEKKVKLKAHDRVSALSTLWYNPDDSICTKFPILYGTVMSCTDITARVFWDVEEDASVIATEKLQLMPKDTALQIEHSDTEPDRSIFKAKGKKRSKRSVFVSKNKRAVTAKRTKIVPASVEKDQKSDDNLSVGDPSDDFESRKKTLSPIRIVNKKVIKRVGNLAKRVNAKKLFGEASTSQKQAVGNKRTPIESEISTLIRKKPKLIKAKNKNNVLNVSDLKPEDDSISSSDTSSDEDDLCNDNDGSSDDKEQDSMEIVGKDDKETAKSLKSSTEKKKKIDLHKFKLKDVKIDYAASEGHTSQAFRPRLIGLVDNSRATAFDHFMLFCPREFIEQILLTEANKLGMTKYGTEWNPIMFGEFLKLFGILLYMETVVLSERKDYWGTASMGPYTPQLIGKYMKRDRFEQILPLFSAFLSPDLIKKKELIEYWSLMDNLIVALNNQFQKALIPGFNLTLDESMVKGYHRLLPGKVKIRRKPTPVGNEILDLCDSETLIVLALEFNQGKEMNAVKEFVDDFGATTAAALRLSQPYWGTGRVVFQDSWFGSVKTCEELLKKGLYSVGVVKTAHKNFPKVLLADKNLAQGEWASAVPTADGTAKIWSCRYVDRKAFQFIASCSTSLEGEPRVDSHQNTIKRPKVASEYFKNAGAIDRFNHCRTGGFGLENAVNTKDPALRQMCGLFGFIETNSFRSYCYFTANIKHKDFKKTLVCLLLENSFDQVNTSMSTTRSALKTKIEESILCTHTMKKYPGKRTQKRCHYCYHGYEHARPYRSCFFCDYCGDNYAICAPTTGRKCWDSHIRFGLPIKKKRSSV